MIATKSIVCPRNAFAFVGAFVLEAVYKEGIIYHAELKILPPSPAI
jgi:hypothetical protein